MKEDTTKLVKGILIWVAVLFIVFAFSSFITSDEPSHGTNTQTTTPTTNTIDTSSLTSPHRSKIIYVKYRRDRVDINHPRWEYLNTSKSSWVRGAWYDDDNDYMIINLSGTYYHYCSLPQSTWNSFKRASSFGSYYNAYIKGDYDCRRNYVPDY